MKPAFRSATAEQKAQAPKIDSMSRRFRKSKTGTTGLIILGLFILLSIFASVLAPYSGYDTSSPPLSSPSPSNLLGTDNIGRDILSVLIYGTRQTLMAGLASVCLWI